MSARLFTAVMAVVVLAFAPSATADPNALWTITHDQCVPDQRQHDDPSPCVLVDLAGGEARGHVVLKDLVGKTQFLVIPTARVSGIESPELLAPDAPNYFAAAWRTRTFVEQRAGQSLPRDLIGLAVNSAASRTQNQLHIHVDCVRADVREALQRSTVAPAPTWAPFPTALAGHHYLATAIAGEDLDGVNPFELLADGVDGARADMGAETLVVVGVHLADGRPGFVLLADRADSAAGVLAAGEELQDHDVCPPPRGQWAK